MNQLKADKIYLYAAILLFSGITIYFSDVPFFWDTVAFSEAAHFFLDQKFSTVILPTALDTGSFPIYSLCMAFFWSIFGKYLWISHLFTFIIFTGILFEFHRMAKLFLSHKSIGLAFLLLFAEPTLMTQSILMGYDLIYVYAFLLSINGILYKRNLSLGAGMLILLLSSHRGIAGAAAIFLIDFLIRRKKISIDFFLPYLIPGIMGIVWTYFHYTESAWIFFSPLRESTHEFMVAPLFMLKRVGFILWKLFDFGRIFWWIILFAGLYTSLKTKSFKGEQKTLWIILIVPLLFFTVIIAPFSVPVSHRYFMVTYVCGIILSSYYIFTLFQAKKTRILLSSILIAVLLSGNFWRYPDRMGNGWDASLKVLPYFSMQKELLHYAQEKKLNQENTAAEFPLSLNFKHALLLEEDFQVFDIDSNDPAVFTYFIHSNMLNTAYPKKIKKIEENWEVEKEWRRRENYIRLYKNPNALSEF